MSENTFWLGIWTLCAATAVSIVFIGTSYWKDHNTKIVKMVKSGVPPVEVMCAMQDDYGKHPTCIILATKQKE